MRLFQAIDGSFIGSYVSKKMDIIGGTDPRRIYVENIRSFYRMPRFAAEFFCNLAVKEGFFVKRYAVSCPQCGRVVMNVEDRQNLPNEIECELCELDERDKHKFKISYKEVMVFYQLSNADSTSTK